MATLLLKKSYLINSLKEVPFKDLWGKHGIFTTMRIIGKPVKIIFFRNIFSHATKNFEKKTAQFANYRSAYRVPTREGP